MMRAVFVAALAMVSWLMFGAHDASWARQQAGAKTVDQQAVSERLRALGPGSEITVYLVDGSKLEGVLREVEADAIVVAPKKGGTPTTIMLTDIQRLQTRGKGHHPITYVLLGAATAIGALIVVALATC
jgi:sRNA-binding regulator protein Hfq